MAQGSNDFKTDELLFEIIMPSGHRCRLFLDGNTEGFPENAVVLNNAFPLFCKLLSLANRPNCQARVGASDET